MYGPTLGSPEQVDSFLRSVVASRGVVRDGERADTVAETGKTVAAFVDHGRWVAECECRGGMACSPHISYAICLDCGRRYRIKFPSAKAIAEATELLDERPEQNRNWHPHRGERPRALRDENESARALGLI
jgi:hypothetical protein